jgi:hypothetical protein
MRKLASNRVKVLSEHSDAVLEMRANDNTDAAKVNKP